MRAGYGKQLIDLEWPKVLNNRLVHCLDKGALHEGQAGFRVNRSYMDNVYTLNEIVQGRLKKRTLSF